MIGSQLANKSRLFSAVREKLNDEGSEGEQRRKEESSLGEGAPIADEVGEYSRGHGTAEYQRQGAHGLSGALHRPNRIGSDLVQCESYFIKEGGGAR